ncbi:ABC transporter substrate-binding protein [Streptomyces sp. NPDC007851]|uniref:ABC transporter substrate-binding protein n=1 Tax=Streptomyces sp. NPDC007851 TaxID=3155008 RepID=UPI00340ACCEE
MTRTSRIGRARRAAATTAVTLAAALTLTTTACSGGGSGQDTADGGTPVSGGSLTFALNQEPQCLDPHATGQSATYAVDRPVVDSLVHLDSSGKITPWLAGSWTISDDQLVYTFRLREGVRFSDGTVFDAAAVKANLDHIVDPRTKSLSAAGYLAPYYRSATVTDAHTVTVRLKSPYASFLSILSTTNFGMESPATLKGSASALCAKIVGTGPFIMDTAWKKGQGVSYHRNPDYRWAPRGAGHQGPAYLGTLRIKLISQDSVRVGALTSGQVDAVARVPALSVQQIKRTRTARIQKAYAPGENYSLYPNTHGTPFSDLRVRQAFHVGIDWDTLVDKLFFGVYSAADGPLSPATRFVADTADTAVSYDKDKAGRLLDEAGWTGRDAAGYRTQDGKRLSVRWTVVKAAESPENITLAEQVQAEAKKLGIDVQIVNLPISQVIPNAENGTYDLLATGFSGLDADVLRKLFGTASIAQPGRMGSNIAKYHNTIVDQDLADAQRTTDADRRTRLYRQAQRQIVQDEAVFPVYASGYLLGVTARTHGITLDAEASPVFYDAWRAR